MEPVPSPQDFQDVDDFTSSEDDDGSTSGSQSDRLNSVLSLACFVRFFLVARCALAPVAPVGSAGSFRFRWASS